MAAPIHLQPPDKFEFAKPDAWPHWIKRFERYRVASSLHEKDGAVQVSALVYTMGSEAEDILTSFRLSEADSTNYDTVKDRFQAHFVHRRNPIYERARFNKRIQEPGETVDSFVTALYCLAEHCDYGELREQMIRDRLVVGLRDANLAEKMQLDSDLKLEDAIKRARNSEAVKGQQSTVRDSGLTPSQPHTAVAVDALDRMREQKHKRTRGRRTGGTPQAPRKHQPSRSSPTRKCGWCGKQDQHPRERCPAKNAKCRLCSKIGHYAAVCRSSRKGAAVSSIDGEDAFLGTIHSGSAWTHRVFLDQVPLEMKLDTGADVTAIPEVAYRQALQSSPELTHPDRILRGPDGKQLPVLGCFKTSLSTKAGGKPSPHTVYVVQGLQTPLLGRPAIQALHLLTQQLDVLPAESLNEPYIRDAFQSLFRGIGTLKGPAHRIRLQDNAIPYSLMTPRRVPLPMVKQVAAELQRMEEQGIIRKVEEPTDWCSGMVIVPKSNGSIRICCDFVQLNKSVRRERPYPAVGGAPTCQYSGSPCVFEARCQ